MLLKKTGNRPSDTNFMYRNKERRKTDETGYKKVKNIIIGLNIVKTRTNTNMCILPHCCFPQINKALILLTLIYFCSWNKRKFKQIFIIVLFDKWRGEGGGSLSLDL